MKDERCGVVPARALPGAAACAIVTVTTFRGGAMHGLRQRQEVEKFVCAALECSVYVAPKEPGLTHEELFAVGRAAGFENGEIADVLPQVAAPIYSGSDNRISPARSPRAPRRASPDHFRARPRSRGCGPPADAVAVSARWGRFHSALGVLVVENFGLGLRGGP